MKRRDLLIRAPALCASIGIGGLHGLAFAQNNVIKLGQSASLTGSQARYGTDIRDGIAAALAGANRIESAKGPRFELVTLDDGGVRDRCMDNVRKLIDDGSSALIGLTSGAAAEACMPIIEKGQVALIGTASGNMGIRTAGHSGAIHVRAGYDVEYKRMVSYVKEFGFQRLGYVFLKDTSKANLSAMEDALKTVGVNPTVVVGIDRNAKTLQPVAQQLLDAKLDCVLFTTNAGPVLSIIEHMNAGKYPGMYFSSSFAGQDLIDGVAATKRSVVMSLVVPRPTALGVGVVNQCKQDLAALGTGATLGVTTLEGYIAGRVAIEASKAAIKGGGASRARIKEALANLRADLGGYRVALTPDNAQGSQYVEMVVIDRYGRIVG
jgi:ABC-type branched-subunit amino acid transport system substrate-binding protein